ncbi:MAG: CarD family transcriptional regulator [Terrisporobacter sp.]|uniref:CarD family transcriptional regulator n=1 Tax=Terrisporobacter sp. TaxID=1965305 RepID=UPI002FCAF46A
MYKIGDFIIYGNNGVCEVEGIGAINISGVNKTKSYYTLKPVSENGKIFVPVDTSVFMRGIITYEEVQQLIKRIPSIKEIECKEKNARLLQVYYTKFLETHKCIDLLSIISSIYDKKANGIINGKKLCQTDEKFMKIATGLINDEFSIVLGIPKNDVQTYIKEKIEKNESKILIDDIKH